MPLCAQTIPIPKPPFALCVFALPCGFMGVCILATNLVDLAKPPAAVSALLFRGLAGVTHVAFGSRGIKEASAPGPKIDFEV